MPSLTNSDTAAPSIWVTLLMAVLLLLGPQVLVSFLFGFFAKLANIADVGYWLGSIEVQMMVMLVASPLTAFLVISFTRTFGALRTDFPSVLAYLNIKWCSTKELYTWILASIATWVVMGILGLIADLPEEAFMLMVRDSNASPLLIFTVICIFAPIVEELVFRGFLFKRFQQTWLATSGAALLTCVLFTLIHGGQYTIVGLLFILTVAAYLSFIRIKTQNTLLCMVAHATNNVLSILALYLLD